MKGCTTWSYHPYQPLLRNTGDIYICRIAPGVNTIHFEWLGIHDSHIPADGYEVYYRKRGEQDFTHFETTVNCACDIPSLDTDTDYEIYVQTGEKKSLVRLARTGKTVGTVVNYLHPEDDVYSFSGKYLCSPSLVRHPDGYLLASMDVFAGNYPQNLSLIFRSDDDGVTWHYVSELMPCFWGKLFIHKGELYMLSCSTEYGDLLIGKSTDGGKTFSAPVTLLRGSNAKNGNDGVHKNPQNIMIYGDRIYETLEWGTWANKEYCHAAMVMSCHVDDDLLNPASWSFSYPKKFEPCAPEIADLPRCTQTIEGTLVVDPARKLLNIMRFGGDGLAICYEVNTEDHDAPLTYSRCMPFPAHLSKFMSKYDAVSGKYYSVATRSYDKTKKNARNLLSLMCSEDLHNWQVVTDLLEYRNCDHNMSSFQDVDFEIEGEYIIYLCRTAFNQAHNYHDANYSTFHRIKDFRKL